MSSSRKQPSKGAFGSIQNFDDSDDDLDDQPLKSLAVSAAASKKIKKKQSKKKATLAEQPKQGSGSRRGATPKGIVRNDDLPQKPRALPSKPTAKAKAPAISKETSFFPPKSLYTAKTAKSRSNDASSKEAMAKSNKAQPSPSPAKSSVIELLSSSETSFIDSDDMSEDATDARVTGLVKKAVSDHEKGVDIDDDEDMKKAWAVASAEAKGVSTVGVTAGVAGGNSSANTSTGDVDSSGTSKAHMPDDMHDAGDDHPWSHHLNPDGTDYDSHLYKFDYHALNPFVMAYAVFTSNEDVENTDIRQDCREVDVVGPFCDTVIESWNYVLEKMIIPTLKAYGYHPILMLTGSHLKKFRDKDKHFAVGHSQLDQRHGKAFHIYCSRCSSFAAANIHAKSKMRKEDIALSTIAVCQFVDQGKRKPRGPDLAPLQQGVIRIHALFPHNIECDVPLQNRWSLGKEQNNAGNGAYKGPFPYSIIFGDMFKKISLALDDFQDDVPPGIPINNGKDDYLYDDRRYIHLPPFDRDMFMEHINVDLYEVGMIRFLVWYLMKMNLVYEFFPQ